MKIINNDTFNLIFLFYFYIWRHPLTMYRKFRKIVLTTYHFCKKRTLAQRKNKINPIKFNLQRTFKKFDMLKIKN